MSAIVESDTDSIQIPGYTIVRKIADSPTASVYLAVQERLERQVALKFRPFDLGKAAQFSDDLLLESRAVGRLNHPNIITVYDVGTISEGHYLAMEYIAGNSLRQAIQQRLSLRSALRIASILAHALAYAHSRHVVHRDIKPENVLLRGNDWPVLTDFSIASLDRGGGSLHLGDAMLGTPCYVTPERIAGKEEDPRSDLYSLGIVLYEMLTGTVPFYAPDTQTILDLQRLAPTPTLPDKLLFLQPLLDRLLSKNPADRFQSAAQFRTAMIASLRNEHDITRELITAPDPNDAVRTHASAETASMADISGASYDSWNLNWISEAVDFDPTPVPPPVQASRSLTLGSMFFSGAVGALAALVIYSSFAQLLHYFVGDTGNDIQTQHVLEQMLAYEGTRSTDSLLGKAGSDTPYATYTAAIAYLQGDTRVITALDKLATRFHARAVQKRKAGQLEQALALVRQGLHFRPEHVPLLKLQEQLIGEVDSEHRRVEIQTLLDKAHQLIQANYLTSPPGNNAFDTLNAVLLKDPKNQAALSILQQITQRPQLVGSAGDNAGLGNESSQALEPTDRISAKLNPPNTEPSQKRERLLNKMLSQAQRQLREGALTSPPGSNALESLRIILTILPGEPTALAGLRQIAHNYTELAETRKGKHDLQGSLAAVNLGLAASPDDATLLGLKRELTSLHGDSIHALLLRADQEFTAMRLTAPPGDNAYDSYRAVLKFDPDNLAAKKGLDLLTAQFELLAKDRERSGHLREALVLVNEGLRIMPVHSGLLAQRKSLRTALAGVSSEKD